jgi:hypothetical protein
VRCVDTGFRLVFAGMTPKAQVRPEAEPPDESGHAAFARGFIAGPLFPVDLCHR